MGMGQSLCSGCCEEILEGDFPMGDFVLQSHSLDKAEVLLLEGSHVLVLDRDGF